MNLVFSALITVPLGILFTLVLAKLVESYVRTLNRSSIPGALPIVGKASVTERPYGKEDLRRDLLDPALSLQDVLAKCGGMSPEEIEEVTKGISGPEARNAERLAWYSKMLQKNATLRVVPPPIIPVVLSVKGRMEVCRHELRQPVYPGGHQQCKVCRDTGYVIIHGG